MGKPHPIELRKRAVTFVEAGNTHRMTALRLGVCVKFVNDMIKLKRETGSLIAKPQGNQGQQSKLNGFATWMRKRLKSQPDMTLDALVLEIRTIHNVEVHRSSVCRFLHRLGLSHKKNTTGQRTKAA